MIKTAIFWPMIAQTALIFAIYLLMAKRRFGAVRDGKATAQDYKIPSVEPAASATVARNLINQFELPVLFYVVCLSLFVTNGAGYVELIVAWIFVVSRYAHAIVHVTVNRLMVRQRLFSVGCLCVFVLWVLLAIHISAI